MPQKRRRDLALLRWFKATSARPVSLRFTVSHLSVSAVGIVAAVARHPPTDRTPAAHPASYYANAREEVPKTCLRILIDSSCLISRDETSWSERTLPGDAETIDPVCIGRSLRSMRTLTQRVWPDVTEFPNWDARIFRTERHRTLNFRHVSPTIYKDPISP
jgi:hypothetical protein